MTMYHKPSGLVKAMNSLVGRLASWGLIPGGTALLAGGEAVLKHGKSDAVRLEELPVEQRAPLIQAYLKKTARVTKREFGIEPDAPIEEFQRIAPDHPVFRITTIS